MAFFGVYKAYNWVSYLTSFINKRLYNVKSEWLSVKLERLNWQLNYISELQKLTEAILSMYIFDENKVFQVVASL
jgi:hypothetical protein